MSHHSKDAIPEHIFRDLLQRKDSVSTQPVFGETGNYPDGKLNEQDEGELVFGVTGDNGIVVLNFGKPVAWVGFTPQEAVALAELLLEHARKQTTDVLTMRLGK